MEFEIIRIRNTTVMDLKKTLGGRVSRQTSSN